MRPHPTVAHPGHPRRRAAFRAAGAAAAIAASAWMVASCSLVYDLTSTQCSTDLDCTSKGGVFAEMVCRENLCEVPVIDEGCTSNAECIDEPGFGGELRACIETECVPVTSPDCPVLLPLDDLGIENLRSSNPLILGGYANIPAEGLGDQIRNYNLALTEVSQNLGGLAGPNGTTRSLVMVVCQGNQVERASLGQSLQHLVRLQVPGVVSALYGDDLQYVFQNGGDQADMFFVSPLEADPVLSSVFDGGLVWHLLPSANYVARAYAPLLDRTLVHLNVTGAVRVAGVVANDIRLLSDIMDTVEDPEIGIKFNGGKTVAQNRGELNYDSFAISETDAEASYTAAIDAILTFKPHVIIAAAYEGFLQRMVPIIERDWPEGVGDPPRPFYVLSPLHYLNRELGPLIQAIPEIKGRLVGVNAAAAEDQSLYQSYLNRWDELYLERPGAAAGQENYYDAPYYLIYSAMAAGSALASGADLASGMRRLVEGDTRFDIGPGDLVAVQAALNAPNSNIQLYGTMGPPDFDVRTGTRASVGSAWCVDAAGNTLADVLRYSTTTFQMAGDMDACVPGF